MDYVLSDSTSHVARDWQQLQNDLKAINGRQYGGHSLSPTFADSILTTGVLGAYKQLLGQYKHENPSFTLGVDYVQGDPYASPSRVRTTMPWHQTGLPDGYLNSDARKIAVCDFVTRVAANFIRSKHLDHNIGDSNGGWSGPKGRPSDCCDY